MFLIFGSANSSNTIKLLEVAKSSRIESYRIDNINEIERGLFKGKKVIGISSGASVPEKIIQEAINFFKELGLPDESISEVKLLDEKVNFSIPENIKKRYSKF